MESLISAIKSKDLALVAAELKTIKDIDQIYNGETALTEAAMTEDSDIIKAILDAGANKDLKNSAGLKAMDISMRSGDIESWSLIDKYKPKPKHKVDAFDVFCRISRANGRNRSGVVGEKIKLINSLNEEEKNALVDFTRNFNQWESSLYEFDHISLVFIGAILNTKKDPFDVINVKHNDVVKHNYGGMIYLKAYLLLFNETKKDPEVMKMAESLDLFNIAKSNIVELVNNGNLNIEYFSNISLDLYINDFIFFKEEMDSIKLLRDTIKDIDDQKLELMTRFVFDRTLSLYANEENQGHLIMIHDLMSEVKKRGLSNIEISNDVSALRAAASHYLDKSELSISKYFDYLKIPDQINLPLVALIHGKADEFDNLMKIGMKLNVSAKDIINQALFCNGTQNDKENIFFSMRPTAKDEMINILIKHGFDIKSLDLQSAIDLSFKEFSGYPSRYGDNISLIASIMISHGMEIDKVKIVNTVEDIRKKSESEKSKPLFQEYTLNEIIVNSESINTFGANGLTPLMMAAKKADPSAIQTFLEGGGDVKLTDDNGLNAFSHLATSRKKNNKALSASLFASHMEKSNKKSDPSI